MDDTATIGLAPPPVTSDPREEGARPTALLPMTQLLRISAYWLGLTAIDAAVGLFITNRLEFDKLVPTANVGTTFFMITGFHGTHVTIGVIFLIIMARKVWRGDFDRGEPGFFTSRKGRYEVVEITGLYWHFVDLVWVFIFALFYLW